MENDNDLSVLIVAYCRHENLQEILNLVEKQKMRSVYISIDAPAKQLPQTRIANQLVIEVAENYKKNSFKNVYVYIRDKNVGCSAAVISSCDWFFKEIDFGVVLEDDCLPSLQFFDFITDYKHTLNANSDIWLISGSQFAPLNVTKGIPSLSNYALIWGWATTSTKWKEIRNLFQDDFELQSKAKLIRCSRIELKYWFSGYRRAMNGFVDAWDTPLLYFMKLLDKKAILPPVNLVTNVGDDSVAVHTREKNPLLRVPLSSYEKDIKTLNVNHQLDSWIKFNIYGISLRHLFTTEITKLLDNIRPSRKKNQLLKLRIKEAKI